jgi:hypothetical protein
MLRGISQRNNFRMRRWITARYRLVPTFANNLSIHDDDSTDRDFILLTRLLCQTQRMPHPVTVAFFVDYSHSIVNNPKKSGIVTSFPVVISVNAMKNTIVKIVLDICYVN